MGKLAPISAILLAVALAAAGLHIVQLRGENAFLRQRIAKLRKAPEPKSAPAAERVLTEEQRNAIVSALGSETGQVWFVTNPGDTESVAYQRAVQDAFEQAGWAVASNAPATFNLRPGVFFLMADDDPPSYVLTALGAFEAADIDVKAGRGYRAFNEEKKKENPSWRGFDMAPDQTFVVAVGPAPRDEPTPEP